MNDWNKYKRTRALKALFEKDSIGYDITDYNYMMRAFCWMKALICLLLYRTNGSYLDSNKFSILTYDREYNLEGMSWESCWVSPYLFKDWNVCLMYDGT